MNGQVPLWGNMNFSGYRPPPPPNFYPRSHLPFPGPPFSPVFWNNHVPHIQSPFPVLPFGAIPNQKTSNKEVVCVDLTYSPEKKNDTEEISRSPDESQQGEELGKEFHTPTPSSRRRIPSSFSKSATSGSLSEHTEDPNSPAPQPLQCAGPVEQDTPTSPFIRTQLGSCQSFHKQIQKMLNRRGRLRHCRLCLKQNVNAKLRRTVSEIAEHVFSHSGHGEKRILLPEHDSELADVFMQCFETQCSTPLLPKRNRVESGVVPEAEIDHSTPKKPRRIETLPSRTSTRLLRIPKEAKSSEAQEHLTEVPKTTSELPDEYLKKLKNLAELQKKQDFSCKCGYHFYKIQATGNLLQKLESHLFSHTSLKPYGCKHCSYTGKGIREHCRTNHGMEVSDFHDYRLHHETELLELMKNWFPEASENIISPSVSQSSRAPTPVATEYKEEFSKLVEHLKVRGKEVVVCKDCEDDVPFDPKNPELLQFHVYEHLDRNDIFHCRLCGRDSWNMKMHFLNFHPKESPNPKNVKDLRHMFEDELLQTFRKCFCLSREKEAEAVGLNFVHDDDSDEVIVLEPEKQRPEENKFRWMEEAAIEAKKLTQVRKQMTEPPVEKVVPDCRIAQLLSLPSVRSIRTMNAKQLESLTKMISKRTVVSAGRKVSGKPTSVTDQASGTNAVESIIDPKRKRSLEALMNLRMNRRGNAEPSEPLVPAGINKIPRQPHAIVPDVAEKTACVFQLGSKKSVQKKPEKSVSSAKNGSPLAVPVGKAETASSAIRTKNMSVSSAKNRQQNVWRSKPSKPDAVILTEEEIKAKKRRSGGFLSGAFSKLLKQVLRINPVKDLSCKICSATFRHSATDPLLLSVTYHVEKHHGGPLYRCLICQYENFEIKSHLQTEHNKEEDSHLKHAEVRRDLYEAELAEILKRCFLPQDDKEEEIHSAKFGSTFQWLKGTGDGAVVPTKKKSQTLPTDFTDPTLLEPILTRYGAKMRSGNTSNGSSEDGSLKDSRFKSVTTSAGSTPKWERSGSSSSESSRDGSIQGSSEVHLFISHRTKESRNSECAGNGSFKMLADSPRERRRGNRSMRESVIRSSMSDLSSDSFGDDSDDDKSPHVLENVGTGTDRGSDDSVGSEMGDCRKFQASHDKEADNTVFLKTALHPDTDEDQFLETISSPEKIISSMVGVGTSGTVEPSDKGTLGQIPLDPNDTLSETAKELWNKRIVEDEGRLEECDYKLAEKPGSSKFLSTASVQFGAVDNEPQNDEDLTKSMMEAIEEPDRCEHSSEESHKDFMEQEKMDVETDVEYALSGIVDRVVNAENCHQLYSRKLTNSVEIWSDLPTVLKEVIDDMLDKVGENEKEGYKQHGRTTVPGFSLCKLFVFDQPPAS